MKFNLLFILFINFLSSSSIEINSTSYDDWVYINLAVGAVVFPDDPENNSGWDIACQRYHFRTNSGLSGNGLGGAYVDSVSIWTSGPNGSYASLLEVPENSFFEKDTIVNTFYNVIDTDGDGVEEHIFGLPGVANPSLETWGWIDVDNNYTMNYTDNQFIVRNGLGTSFYKVWVVDYYNDNGTSGYIKIYFDQISSCSIGHDECGECDGDGSSCYGCMDEFACNYDAMASITENCEYSEENYDCDGNCIGIDSDGDLICDILDDCPNIFNPYQHDEDQDGQADACNDDDDDGDGLIDCWSYWYDDGINMTDEEITAAIDSGVCGDFALGIDIDISPTNFKLYQNHPNPFNPSTAIEYSLLNPSSILIDIFDVNGKNIITLENSFKSSGHHILIWDGSNKYKQKMPSGMYIYRLVSNGIEIDRKKMLLLY